MKRIAVVLMAMSGPAFAGWFGPSSFEECVDKMRHDPDRPTVDYIRRTCYRQFPPTVAPEPEPVEIELIEGRDYNRGDLTWKNCSDNDNSLSVCLDKNDTRYKITRAEILAWRITCDKTLEDNNPPKFQTKQSPWGGKFTAYIKDSYLVKCKDVSWYGVPRK